MRIIDKARQNPRRFCRWIYLKFLKLNRVTKPLILYPSYLTALIVIMFFSLAISKGLLSKQVNEIGDAIAGFSGVVAFLWLIVAVLLQNRDLNLQYSEIKDMRAASESQAQSLESSQIFQALEYLEVKLEKIEPYLIERRDLIIEELKLLSGECGTEFTYDLKLDLADAMDHFVLDSNADNVLNFHLDNIQPNFSYQSYLRFQAIHFNMEQIVEAYQTLLLNVPTNIEKQVKKYTKAHAKQLMVDWVWWMLPYMDKLYTVLGEAVMKHKKGSDANRLFIRAFLNKEENS